MALSISRFGRVLVFALGGLVIASAALHAQDKIVRKNGSTQDGRLTGVGPRGAALEIQVGSGKGEVVIALADIASVEMTVPPEIEQTKTLEPAKAVTLLEPVLAKYKGLPADWVVDAMAKVADGYTAQGKAAQSAALYEEMAKLYPGSRYLIKANVGQAKGALGRGQADEALKLLEPLIGAANKTLFPSPAEARLYGEAFLVKGQALELKKDLPGALESYAIVVAAFYQNPEVTKDARDRADKLRKQDPTLTVE